MSFPPVYGGTFSVSQRPSTAGAVRPLTEHVFEIKDKKKKPWATLKLSSSAPRATSLPTFLEGDKINGSVTLDLSNSEKILGVSILIRGSVVTGLRADDRVCFLDTTTPLWLKGMANPRESNVATSASPYDGRLSGDYHWPFSISLPKEVTLADPNEKHGPPQTYHLPQSFLERNTRGSVYYELFVHIARSTFRVDNKLQTMFLAYRQNGPVPGPDMDPGGWHTLPPTVITGTVFNTRRVKMQCVLSLAKPLSFTRGSVIPCSLTYLCDDSQALNLICTPATTNVCLHRQVTFRQAPVAAEYCVRDTIDDGVLEISPRRLIHLPKSLKPSSAVSHFSVSYFVVMLPFQVTGFSSQDAKPALKQEVQIATMFPKGPKPRIYSPPHYEYEIGDNMFIPPARGYI
ncbi:hypothetical protein DFH09DRAFT_1331546 [Mycena vulgaris]|nr:hypothetical protein DFH09DRAFT_1331546 [Mycena vulgaris]